MTATAGNPGIQSKADFPDTPQGWQRRWSAELAAAKKASRKWKEHGQRITKVFLDERGTETIKETTRLNLFSANVITLRAMMYGNVPRVEVTRRYEDANDDAARVASEMLERIANADVGKQYSYALGMALEDRLLVGFGLGRVAYEAQFKSIHHDPIVASDGRELAAAYDEEQKTFEAAPVYYLNWRDVEWSPARSWDEVRWIGFRNYLTRDQCVKRFGAEVGEAIPLGKTKLADEVKGGIEEDPWQKAEVWEIWHAEDQQVFWVVEGMDKICDRKDDTLQLKGFWPCPKFLLANPTSQAYVPRADYVLAQDQYREVDELSTRITLLQKAIKVVGVYDRAATGVKRLLNEGVANTMIPVDDWAMFAEKGGLKGQIDWLPLEQIVGALDRLREYRADLINVLYQVTGMSDIMRGATVQGETATAQSIKAKFASVRVQYLQDEFASFATDLQKLRVEVIARHFDDQSIVTESNMQATLDAEFIPPALQLIRQREVFRIAVKSEQLQAQDMAALRQEKAEFIAGLAQFITAAKPLTDSYPQAAPVLLEMLKWTMTGFKGASSIEGILDKAIASLQQAPPQQPPNPEEAKQKALQLKVQGEVGKEQVKQAGKQQEIAAKSRADLTRIGAETQAEIRKQAAQFAFDTRENQRKEAIEATRAVVTPSRPPA
jgi:hypothetical protein